MVSDYYNERVLIHGDALAEMRKLADCSVDAVVTDPPYGINFMNKKWDYQIPCVELWRECLRVMKPGSYALVACGPRTQHRMACNLEDAGFEIRDIVAWLYGSGFPKSKNIGGGFGTALKPAMELWSLVRKPLDEKTVAANVLTHGTGALNIDGCRVETSEGINTSRTSYEHRRERRTFEPSAAGRWPANVTHDGSDEVLELFPDSKGQCGAVTGDEPSKKTSNLFGPYSQRNAREPIGDTGSAARFYYCAKASKSERNHGLAEFDSVEVVRQGLAGEHKNPRHSNHHPTVKPVKLMRWLCRLVTPPGGVVLDPFVGSGTTGIAAKLEKFEFIGIERELEYIEIASARIAAA